MALFASISISPLSVSLPLRHRLTDSQRFHRPLASTSSSTPEPSPPSSSSSPPPSPSPTTFTSESSVSSKNPSKPFVESTRPTDSSFNYALANPSGSSVVRFFRATESSVERAIFDFRFLALFAVGGSLAVHCCAS